MLILYLLRLHNYDPIRVTITSLVGKMKKRSVPVSVVVRCSGISSGGVWRGEGEERCLMLEDGSGKEVPSWREERMTNKEGGQEECVTYEKFCTVLKEELGQYCCVEREKDGEIDDDEEEEGERETKKKKTHLMSTDRIKGIEIGKILPEIEIVLVGGSGRGSEEQEEKEEGRGNGDEMEEFMFRVAQSSAKVVFGLQEKIPGQPVLWFCQKSCGKEKEKDEDSDSDRPLKPRSKKSNFEIPASHELVFGHLDRLREEIGKDASQVSVTTVSMLSPVEEQIILGSFRGSFSGGDFESTIPRIFESVIQDRMDQIALRFRDLRMTFRELNARVNQLAHFLRNVAGVGPGVIVGHLLLREGVDYFLYLLAILKAGGIFFPMDVQFPTQQKKLMIGLAGCELILVNSSNESRVRSIVSETCRVIAVDNHSEGIATLPTSNPADLVQPSDHAALLHTSGSTGLPKGVLVSHRFLARYVGAYRRGLESIGVHWNTYTQFTNLCFGVCLAELSASWLLGKDLLVIPTEIRYRGGELLDYLIEHNIVTADFAPSVLPLLPRDHDLGTLQYVITGGEMLDGAAARFWGDRGLNVVNTFGQTDCIFRSHARVIGSDSPSLIGFPFEDMSTYILDKYLQPLPLGCYGSMWHSGPVLAEYQNRPDQVKLKSVPDLVVPGNVMFDTLDLCRFLPDGDMEFKGRNTDRVTLDQETGLRARPSQIAKTIKSHDAVKQAVIVLRPIHPKLDPKKVLVGFIVLEDAFVSQPSSVVLDSIQEFASARLPGVFVPTKFVIRKSIPLNFSGKIWKAKLKRSLIAQETSVPPQPRGSRRKKDSAAIHSLDVKLRQSLGRFIKSKTLNREQVRKAVEERKKFFEENRSDFDETQMDERLAAFVARLKSCVE